jgi:hypothetical protein
MKRNPNEIKPIQDKPFMKKPTKKSIPMVNPVLFEKVQKVGMIMQTGVDVLGLSSHDSKKLKEAGIFTLEQLGVCDVETILVIPRFGVTKAARMKNSLNEYLTSVLNGYEQEFKRSEGEGIGLQA